MLMIMLADQSSRAPLPEALTRYTGFLVAKAHQRLFDEFSAVCRGHDLEVQHPGILHVLRDSGPMSQQELGAPLRIDRTSMVKLLDLLEKRGFATREDNPSDRRKYFVKITAAGRTALAAIARAGEKMERKLLAPFTAPERKLIRRALLTLAG